MGGRGQTKIPFNTQKSYICNQFISHHIHFYKTTKELLHKHEWWIEGTGFVDEEFIQTNETILPDMYEYYVHSKISRKYYIYFPNFC